jgi:hypothetical protein
MSQTFRLYRRKTGGRYYLHNDLTGKQESLHTSDRAQAMRLWHAKNEAGQLPAINLQIARAYLAATDPQIAKRTWQNVMDEATKLKKRPTLIRWTTAMRDQAFDAIRHCPSWRPAPSTSCVCWETATSARTSFCGGSKTSPRYVLAAVAGAAQEAVAGH